jgi:hypothetical protein
MTELWRAQDDHWSDIGSLRRVLEIAKAIRERNTGRVGTDADSLVQTIEPRIRSLETAASATEASSPPIATPGQRPEETPPQTAIAPPGEHASQANWVAFCVWVFGAAAVLSVIGGIVTGIAASDNLGPELRARLKAEGVSAREVGVDPRDEAILIAWIIGGFIAAALWVGMAVLLTLLRDTTLGIATLVRQGQSSQGEPG